MKLSLSVPSGSYEILIERGCLYTAQKLLSAHHQVLIVTDSGVPAAYAEAVAKQCENPVLLTVGEGEGSKSIPVWQSLLETMLSHRFTRADAVVAVGGGVVGDLCGFAAASYMRGIAFYNIPTTLLSQVDSAIGGKTALNLGNIKNSIGAFYQPRAVLIDPNVLQTLPARQIACGYAEIIKMAICEDAALFDTLEEKDSTDITDIIARTLAIKKRIVEADEKEHGLRRVLNFGHTLGHGIESTAAGTLFHGECVAMGMLPVTDEKTRSRLCQVLKAYGLPVCPDLDPVRILEAMEHDKKANGTGMLRIILVTKPGEWREEEMTADALLKKAAPIWKESNR